ncbi:hypothetical protein ACFRQM_48055 [Streptomyces sp. NPDC056831]|uniref:hypothetical protein n=1 Tax=Streptomyces sp. NPDC056831 TaxID=3345954 RepID=UPI0036C1E0F3
MEYEVIRVKFRAELHARWSVFFDHLRVPWAYEPVTFYDGQGAPRTPAFWLPEQRIWFAAEVEAPVWWGRFVMAADGSAHWDDRWGEEAGRCLPVEIPEEWHGATLLAEAHGRVVREARRAACAVFSDLAGTASGDLESGETGETLVITGVEGAGQGKMAGSADLAANAQHRSPRFCGYSRWLSCALRWLFRRRPWWVR